MPKAWYQAWENLVLEKECKSKTTVRYHLTLVRMVTIKKPTNNKCWRGCGGGTLLCRWWECKLVQPLWRTLWRSLRKLEIEPPHNPAVPLLGVYWEKILIWKDTWTAMFMAALFTVAMETTWKHSKSPLTDEWIKMRYIYTTAYYSTIKQEWNDAIFSNMSGPRDYDNKWSEIEKDKYHMISLICGT